jgi:hypothetical protein
MLGVRHRVYRVPYFLSNRPIWVSPTPAPESECCPPPFGSNGETHSLVAGEGMGGGMQLPLSGVCYITMKKLAQPDEGGVHAHPLSTITYKVVVYAPAERADTLPLFIFYPYMYSVVLRLLCTQSTYFPRDETGLVLYACALRAPLFLGALPHKRGRCGSSLH